MNLSADCNRTFSELPATRAYWYITKFQLHSLFWQPSLLFIFRLSSLSSQMATSARATERGRLLDAVHVAHEHLSEALEAATRSLEDAVKVIAEMIDQTGVRESEAKDEFALAHIQELMQFTQVAFIRSRRWTSLCGSTTRSVTAKFQSIADLAMNMRRDHNTWFNCDRLEKAMTKSARCYKNVECKAWSLQAANTAAGLRFKWNMGTEIARERQYAAVALEEPRKQGMLSVRVVPHRTRATTLDFWGPGLEDTRLTASVLSEVLRLGSNAVESEMTTDIIDFQRDTAKGLAQEFARFEEEFSFHGRPAVRSESGGANIRSSQTLEPVDLGRLDCAAIGIDCRKYFVPGSEEDLGKGAFTVLFPTLEDGIPFQPIGKDPRRILEAEKGKDSGDPSSVLHRQLSFLQRVRSLRDAARMAEATLSSHLLSVAMHSLGGVESLSRQDIDFELGFLHNQLDNLLVLRGKPTGTLHGKIEAFKKCLLDNRHEMLFGKLPEELEAAENEYWGVARHLQGTTLYDVILRSMGSYSNIKYMIALRKKMVSPPADYSTVSSVKPSYVTPSANP